MRFHFKTKSFKTAPDRRRHLLQSSKITTATCQLLACYNKTLINDKKDLLSPSTIIGKTKEYQKLISATSVELSKLVEPNTTYEGAVRRKVKSRLEMETRLRCLVTSYFLNAIMDTIEPEKPLTYLA